MGSSVESSQARAGMVGDKSMRREGRALWGGSRVRCCESEQGRRAAKEK